ncbi:hypothetical protein TNCV_3251741 [Trichonephila clavipes]|nr:hypothetical protein TNCV_3251741 [Trichonephila clavipes]
MSSFQEVVASSGDRGSKWSFIANGSFEPLKGNVSRASLRRFLEKNTEFDVRTLLQRRHCKIRRIKKLALSEMIGS